MATTIYNLHPPIRTPPSPVLPNKEDVMESKFPNMKANANPLERAQHIVIRSGRGLHQVRICFTSSTSPQRNTKVQGLLSPWSFTGEIDCFLHSSRKRLTWHKFRILKGQTFFCACGEMLVKAACFHCHPKQLDYQSCRITPDIPVWFLFTFVQLFLHFNCYRRCFLHPNSKWLYVYVCFCPLGVSATINK